VPYELALRMKQLGFDEPCFAYYDMAQEFNFPGCTMHNRNFINLKATMTSLYQQAFRWFREKYFYISYVCAPYKEYDEFYFRIRYIGDVLNEGQLESCESQVYKTYEEAELACLEKLIEIVESKKEK
jgi:hypothetical protein